MNTTMKRYKIIDRHGNLRTIHGLPEVMDGLVMMGLAMKALPSPKHRWIMPGARDHLDNNRICVEPFEWDHDKMMEAYAPLIMNYKRMNSISLRHAENVYRNAIEEYTRN